MYSLKARCGSCEYIWDISEYGFKTCPQCGSTKVDVASNVENAIPLGPPDGFFVQISPVGAQPVKPSFTDITRSTRTKRPQGVLVIVVWMLICAVATGLFMGLSVPAVMLPIRLMLFISAVVMAAKLGLILIIKSLVGSDSFKLGGTTLGSVQLVGYCFLDIAIWSGIAMLLVIWWPTAAVCCLLIYAAHACIGIVSILSEAVLKLRVNVLMVAVYSVMVAAFGYHFLHYLVIG